MTLTLINGRPPKKNLTHVLNTNEPTTTMCGLPVAEARAIDTTPTLRKMTCAWCHRAMQATK